MGYFHKYGAPSWKGAPIEGLYIQAHGSTSDYRAEVEAMLAAFDDEPPEIVARWAAKTRPQTFEEASRVWAVLLTGGYFLREQFPACMAARNPVAAAEATVREEVEAKAAAHAKAASEEKARAAAWEAVCPEGQRVAQAIHGWCEENWKPVEEAPFFPALAEEFGEETARLAVLYLA
jgi:hypothetical protein